MGRPRSSIETESVGVRLTTSLLAKLDEYASEHKISRSAAASDGIKRLVNSKECLSCGTLNPAEGNMCAKCGTPLYSDLEILRAMELVLETKKGKYTIQKRESLEKYLDAGLTPVYKLKIRRCFGLRTKYCVDLRFETETGLEMQPTDKSLVDKEIPFAVLLKYLPDARKEFQANPDLQEEIRKKYLKPSV